MTAVAPPRSRLRPQDTLRAGAGSLRSRAWRAALSALGVAIGIGAAVAVLGVSASSRASLLRELGAEGNLLTVGAGEDVTGAPAALPVTAPGMIARIPPVESVSAVGYLPGVIVRRTAAVPTVNTGGISVLAAQTSLLRTLDGRVARGAFLNAATVRYPAVVLGAVAARTLGIGRVTVGTQVYLGNQYFTVVGILRPVPLAPEIDEAALVGFPVANALLGLGGHPTEIYLRAQPDQVQAVDLVLPFTANPALPEAVQVSLAVPAARRPGAGQVGAHRAVPCAGRGRRADRRGGHRQHHGDLSAGTPDRDRAAPRPGRDPASGRRPVPHRVGAAVGHRRGIWGRPWCPGHGRVCAGYWAGGGAAFGRFGGWPRGGRAGGHGGRRLPGGPRGAAATG